MTTTDTNSRIWLAELGAARRSVEAGDVLAVVGLETLWRTVRAIEVADTPATENWWAYLAEAVASASDSLGESGTQVSLGAGPGPAAALLDVAEVREAAAALAAAVHAALTRLIPTAEPRSALAAGLAAASLERALGLRP